MLHIPYILHIPHIPIFPYSRWSWLPLCPCVTVSLCHHVGVDSKMVKNSLNWLKVVRVDSLEMFKLFVHMPPP